MSVRLQGGSHSVGGSASARSLASFSPWQRGAMEKRCSIGLAIIVASLLFGCGGSDVTGPMAPAPDDQEIHDKIGTIGRSATRIVSTDLVVTASPVPLPAERFPVACFEDACTAALPTGPAALQCGSSHHIHFGTGVRGNRGPKRRQPAWDDGRRRGVRRC